MAGPPRAAACEERCRAAAEGLVVVEFDNRDTDDSIGLFRPWRTLRRPIGTSGFALYFVLRAAVLLCIVRRLLFSTFDPSIL